MEKISPLGTDKMTHSTTTETGTALGVTTKISGKSTSASIIPQNLGTTSNLSTPSAEVKRRL